MDVVGREGCLLRGSRDRLRPNGEFSAPSSPG